MPKSKRKSVAARAAAAQRKPADFVKTKTKLGKRKRSDSLVTSSAVTSRKIYVPPQGASAASLTSVSDHIARARDHYNTHARAGALIALGRIPSADAAPVLRVALEALLDDAAPVRSAALGAAVAVLGRVSVAPFAPLLAAALATALSHVRADVRVFGARATCAVFDVGGFGPADVFGGGDSLNPLPLLVALAADVGVGAPRARAIVARAIAAVSSWSGKEEGGRGEGDGAFYYHRMGARKVGAGAGELPLLALDKYSAAKVVAGVSNMVLEDLPVRDGPSPALVASARALSTVVCDASVQEKLGRDAATRAVAAWAAEQVSGPAIGRGTSAAADVDASMASTAVALGDWAVVCDYLCGRFEGRAEGGSGKERRCGWTAADGVAMQVVSEARVPSELRLKVCAAWLASRWEDVVERGILVDESSEKEDGTELVKLFRHILVILLQGESSGDKEVVWVRVLQLPTLIAKVSEAAAREEFEPTGSGRGRRRGDEVEGAKKGHARSRVKADLIIFGLVSALEDAIRLHPWSDSSAVGESIAKLLLRPKITLQWLEDASCASKLIYLLWYLGCGRCSTVLSLLNGSRGWNLAAAAARVVDQEPISCARESDSSCGQGNSREGADLILLAAALSGLLCAARRQEGVVLTLNEKDARAYVSGACTKLVQGLGVGKESVESILSVHGASAAEIGVISEVCCA